MTTTADTLAAATALVSSLSAGPTAAALPLADHDQAMAALRAAQVELYCDHDAAAMTALREARRALAGLPSEAAALAAMESAAWHIRRHEAREAQIAMALAQQQLG